jgi:hypothetical protein
VKQPFSVNRTVFGARPEKHRFVQTSDAGSNVAQHLLFLEINPLAPNRLLEAMRKIDAGGRTSGCQYRSVFSGFRSGIRRSGNVGKQTSLFKNSCG